MGGTREAAKRAKGTRRRPLRVRRGTRAGEEILSKKEPGERGLEPEQGRYREGEEVTRQGHGVVKEIGLERRAKMMVVPRDGKQSKKLEVFRIRLHGISPAKNALTNSF